MIWVITVLKCIYTHYKKNAYTLVLHQFMLCIDCICVSHLILFLGYIEFINIRSRYMWGTCNREVNPHMGVYNFNKLIGIPILQTSGQLRYCFLMKYCHLLSRIKFDIFDIFRTAAVLKLH